MVSLINKGINKLQCNGMECDRSHDSANDAMEWLLLLTREF